MVETGRTARELADVMTRLPQALINVKDVDRARATIDRGVTDAIAAAERELGETGRVLLRPSGTEPVVRVMVEAPHDDQRSEEHTSELQSRGHLVCRLLHEKHE